MTTPLTTGGQTDRKMLISFSGGKTSAYMTWRLLQPFNDRYDWEKVVVFANTGKEKEETLEFVNECDKKLGFNVVWVETDVHFGRRKGSTHKVVSFETAARNGQPFEAVIKKYGIPNQSFPHCTRELKTNPIHSYIKNELGWTTYCTAIGIRADEIDRINPDNVRNKNFWYPLADWGINSKIVNDFWASGALGFTLNILPHQGNCDFCWKKTQSKLQLIYKENPEVANWWKKMEDKYGQYMPATRKADKFKPPFVFGRQNLSINQIIGTDPEDIPDDINDFGCKETCEPFNELS